LRDSKRKTLDEVCLMRMAYSLARGLTLTAHPDRSTGQDQRFADEGGSVMKKLAIGLVGGFVMSIATYASATTVLTAFMTGDQENPPTGSPGTGGCRVVLDEVTGALTMSGSFSGLAGTANNAHIHGPAPVGMNAPVLVPATFTAATSGQFGIASATLTPTQ